MTLGPVPVGVMGGMGPEEVELIGMGPEAPMGEEGGVTGDGPDDEGLGSV